MKIMIKLLKIAL